jgi:hypothetical protein
VVAREVGGCCGTGTNRLLLLVVEGGGLRLFVCPLTFFATRNVWHSRIGMGFALAGYRYVGNRTVLRTSDTMARARMAYIIPHSTTTAIPSSVSTDSHPAHVSELCS